MNKSTHVKKTINISVCSLLSLLIMLAVLFHRTDVYASEGFSDVPPDHWAAADINALRTLGVTSGIGGNTFGLGKAISRGDFASFLAKLPGWDVLNPEGNSYPDNPDRAITREEMAVMVITALGYDQLAGQLGYLQNPYTDVTSHTAQITMASDFGIISGTGDGLFMPDATATREQAAVMLMRMYRSMQAKITHKNGFYAISSFSQMRFIDALDSTGFGWSKIEVNGGVVTLNTTSSNNNEYRIPSGYDDPLARAKAAGKALLMVTSADGVNISEYVLPEQSRGKVIDLIMQTVEGGDGPTFDGVVIDLENLRGEQAKSDFVGFLTALKPRLNGKLLYVAVQPERRPGLSYYDAYDFHRIGELADKVILMAHDYNAKKLTPGEMQSGETFTPLTPIDEIYYALRAITDEQGGVGDKSKVLLQFSFDTAQWKVLNDVVSHDKPYNPGYETLRNRMLGDVEFHYSQKYESPYITFINNEDNTQNIVWYEDARSIAAKVKLAKMFGVTGISVWRMGSIPDYQIEGKEIYLKLLDYLRDLS